MIATHIYTKNKEIAQVISTELFKKNLIFKASTIETANHIDFQDNKTTINSFVLLITLGKAIHFSEIKLILSQLFPNDSPFYYAVPVLNCSEQL